MVSSAASLKRAGLLSLPLPILGAAFTMLGPCLFWKDRCMQWLEMIKGAKLVLLQDGRYYNACINWKQSPVVESGEIRERGDMNVPGDLGMWVAGEMAPGIKCFLCKPQDPESGSLACA